MENTQNNQIEYSSGDNSKKVLLTVIVGVVVLGALVWWMKGTSVSQQAQTSPTPDAESAAINQDIDNINVGDLNAELDAIDKNLQGL
jgi:hypothetical protein